MAANPPFMIRVETHEAALSKTMHEMMTWLDRHRVKPVEFKIAMTEILPNIAFDIQFQRGDEAALFEREFA
jgi:hypothetical protein